MVRTRFALILYFRMVPIRLLMLEVLFTQDKDLFCGGSSGPEQSLFFSSYLFSFGFKPIQDNVQHNLARKTDEANSSVVLAEL